MVGVEPVRDFIPVVIICKFHKDLIKTKHVILRTRSNMALRGKSFRREMATVRTRLIFYAYPVFFCKFHKEPIKN